MADAEPPRYRPSRRPQFDNGNSQEWQRRKDGVDWDQMLLETGIDQWDIADRREMQANLAWVSEHRRNVGARRRMTTLALGIMVPLLAGFGSLIGSAVSSRTASTCPAGYVCTIAPTPTP